MLSTATADNGGDDDKHHSNSNQFKFIKQKAD